MDIRDYKRAEIDLKILERDRRDEIVEWKRVKGEWARDDAILNKHRRALDGKKRQIDQQEIVIYLEQFGNLKFLYQHLKYYHQVK